MKTRFLLLAIPLVAAAAPPQGFSLQVPPSYPFTARAPAPPPASSRPPGPVYEPAPLPNPNIAPPTRADSGGPEISPSLFNRSDQFRGDSFTKGDSAQSTQDRNLRPSPGFRLRMPLTPQDPP
jgi:hypothetical protein